jgi:hypothetical protein
MRLLLAFFASLLFVPTAFATDPEPLGCSDFVFLQPGLSCDVVTTSSPDGEAFTGIVGTRVVVDNEGNLYSVFQSPSLPNIGDCGGGAPLTRKVVRKFDGANAEVIIFADYRCHPGELVTRVDFHHLTFDPVNGVLYLTTESLCFDPVSNRLCAFDRQWSLFAISGFPTLGDVLGQPTTGPCDDADGDGECNATDLCFDTPQSESVDSDGCSLEQFCTSIDPNVPRPNLGIRHCVLGDWRNTEHRDCRVVRVSEIPALFECVPK